MPLSAPRDDQFTREEGELVRHLIGMRCWCQGADGQVDPTCTEHERGGWLYRDEHKIWGLVTDVRQSKELAALGLWLPGDCVFSPESKDLISEDDKIIFTWPLPHGSGDVRVRGAGDADRLVYEAIRAIWCEDQDKVRYTEGTDFYLDGKEIVWTWATKDPGAKAPAAAKRYVIKYTAFLEWIVFIPPVERQSHGDKIGSKVMLRKKHLMEAL